MNLQDTFYILGIICMSLMLIVAIAVLAAILVIKTKINAIHRAVDEKLNAAMSVMHASEAVASAFKRQK